MFTRVIMASVMSWFLVHGVLVMAFSTGFERENICFQILSTKSLCWETLAVSRSSKCMFSNKAPMMSMS